MNTKRVYKKRLGQLIARDALRSIHGKYHVIPQDPRRWSVVAEGSTRFSRMLRQIEAVMFAKKSAIKKIF